MSVRVLGVVSDPDLPTEIVTRIADDLPSFLRDNVSDKVGWEIETASRSLPIDADGYLEVWKHSGDWKSEYGWDYVVCLTELTRHLKGQLIISDVSVEHDVAVVSLPALGPLRQKHHVRNAIARVARVMLEDDLQPERDEISPKRPFRFAGNLDVPREKTVDQSAGAESYLALTGFSGRLRLLAGMVRINRPWRLIPSLSTAIAAASAAAAFGIFYSSIWNMSDALSPLRLTIISLAGIATLVTWLIVYNDLWERHTPDKSKSEVALYNTATVLTLSVGVVIAYVLLLMIAFLAAMTVIPARYMHTTLNHSVTWLDYAQLAWLASSMGIFAGALGSSFESDDAVRQATYGRREQERHVKRGDSEE